MKPIIALSYASLSSCTALILCSVLHVSFGLGVSEPEELLGCGDDSVRRHHHHHHLDLAAALSGQGMMGGAAHSAPLSRNQA
jgi:hypothetical protein